MHLLPPNAPLDAFFAPVRRRHPDLDIVVLPAPEPPTAVESVGDTRLAAILDQVAVCARRASAAALPTAPSPTARWSFGPGEGTVTASARSAVTTSDGFEALMTLREALETEGWRVHRLPGSVERIVGVRDDVRIQASYAESTGAFLLAVRSQPSHVGKARARALVRP